MTAGASKALTEHECWSGQCWGKDRAAGQLRLYFFIPAHWLLWPIYSLFAPICSKNPSLWAGVLSEKMQGIDIPAGECWGKEGAALLLFYRTVSGCPPWKLRQILSNICPRCKKNWTVPVFKVYFTSCVKAQECFYWRTHIGGYFFNKTNLPTHNKGEHSTYATIHFVCEHFYVTITFARDLLREYFIWYFKFLCGKAWVRFETALLGGRGLSVLACSFGLVQNTAVHPRLGSMDQPEKRAAATPFWFQHSLWVWLLFLLAAASVLFSCGFIFFCQFFFFFRIRPFFMCIWSWIGYSPLTRREISSNQLLSTGCQKGVTAAIFNGLLHYGFNFK